MDFLLTDLELKIQDFIELLYNCTYNKRLIVRITDDDYTLELPLSSEQVPLTLTLQTTDEDVFFDFICKELDERRLDKTQYLTIKYIDNE